MVPGMIRTNGIQEEEELYRKLRKAKSGICDRLAARVSVRRYGQHDAAPASFATARG